MGDDSSAPDHEVLIINNARFPDSDAMVNITCFTDGRWTATTVETACNDAASSGAPFASNTKLTQGRDGVQILNAVGSLVIPGGLVHPHIHLDKCHLLDCCSLETGTFDEALSSTAEAKKKFTQEDVIARGTRLVRESISHGVTAMRAHVEVDPTVSHVCLEAGFHLRRAFTASCTINLVAFAQDPFFYPKSPNLESSMHSLFDTLISNHLSSSPDHTHFTISAVGSAPYVEESYDLSVRNIKLVFSLARRARVDVDFHLDYDLDPSKPTLLWDVLRLSKLPENTWTVKGRTRRITLGHCTKMTLFGEADVDRLVRELEGLEKGEICFVGLPNSDLYMMGRDVEYGKRMRGTLNALELKKRGVQSSVGVNNVGNLFTPQGDGDPLAMLPDLVEIYQAAQPDSLRSLLDFVTTSAALAAGLDRDDLSPNPAGDAMAGMKADFVILDGCKSVRDAVLAPPYGRTTVVNGRLVARRTVESFTVEPEEI